MEIRPKPEGSIWTDEQWRAVCLRGQNILVSAGAGSGKTAVLTERIIEHIRNGVDVSQLVVLTFTNAAAREMRERVKKAIIKQINDGNPAMKYQLELLDGAQITTFDAYSQFIVKKYHYLLNIDKNIQIIDNILFTDKRNEIVNQVFDEYYLSEDPAFLKLIDTYCIMDDSKLKQQVINLMAKLEMKIDHYDLETYLSPVLMQDYAQEYFKLVNNKLNELNSLVNELEAICSHEKVLDHVASIRERFSDLYNRISYDEFYKYYLLIAPKFKPMPRQKFDEKDLYKEKYEQVKKKFKELDALCTYESSQEMIDELALIKPLMATLIELAYTCNHRFFAYKQSENMYDFIDINHLAIKVLKDNPAVCQELSSNIYEIMIDEYQDTNDIQEYFIEMIANNNVYMVGDIKQSIYGFRNANPDNFANKYLNYAQNKGGALIDLNKNFRSREEVLMNINTIFKPLMDLEIGGIDYDENQALVYGNKMYETKNPKQDQNMEIYCYDKDEVDDFNEYEARVIASDIRRRIDTGYQVLDGGQMRNCTYKDFAVLSAKKKNFETYKRVFEEYQIPLETQLSATSSTNHEIYFVNAIFRILYCLESGIEGDARNSRNQDHFKFAMTSIMRSFVINLDDDEICEQLTGVYNLYQLKDKTKHPQVENLCQKIIDLHLYEQSNSLVDTLIKLIADFNLMENLSRLDNVNMAQSRLLSIIDLFTKFNDLNYQLADVVKYEQKMIDNKLEMEFNVSSGANDNVSQMMTIHKSKGLEFNVVYFPDLSGKFNQMDAKSKFKYNQKYGYMIPLNQDEEKATILNVLSREEEIKASVSEEIRLFYVALTRAKDKMIMLFSGEMRNEMPVGKLDNLKKLNYKSFNTIIKELEGNLVEYSTVLTDADVIEPKVVKSEEQNIGEQFTLEYRKLNLIEEEIVQGRASIDKPELIDKQTRKMMDTGTKYHNILETIDFTGDVAKQVTDHGPREQAMILNVAKLAFMQEAINVYPEYQFQFMLDGKLINGIIDVLIETENEFVILDYKLDNVHKPEYEKQLKIYRDFVMSKTNKPVLMYLYSLLSDELLEIK